MADEIWGVCSVCRVQVLTGEKYSHPCPGFHVIVGWQALENPHNNPWVPGYRFCLRQHSKNAKRGSWRMATRVYRVFFEIDQEGVLRWTGGVKATPETEERAAELYARGRPGSNYAASA